MDRARFAAVSHDFVHMDLDFKEAMEVEPANFVLKATWDTRRPRLVLKESIATGTLFDDFDKITAMLHDSESCALIIRAGVESSKCWVAVTWIPDSVSGASPTQSAPFDHFGESIMRVWPEFRVLELRAQDRKEVTLEAVSAKCMEVLNEQKEDEMKEAYTTTTSANIGNLDAWLAEQGYGGEEPVMDLSGVYASSAGEDVVLSQIGDAGEVTSASSVWAYTIDGSTMSLDDSDSQGTLTGSKGSYVISWSDGYIYTQQRVPSAVVKVKPHVAGRQLPDMSAPDTSTAGLLLRQIALDSGDRWEDLRLVFKGQPAQLDWSLLDLGMSGEVAVDVVRN